MRNPHLPYIREADATGDTAALYKRAHDKLGPAALPEQLLRLGGSQVLFRDAMLNLEKAFAEAPPLLRADRLLVGIGVASAAGTPDLARWVDELAQAAEVPEESRRAAVEVGLACRTLNAYYRVVSLAEGAYPADVHAKLRASPMVGAKLPKSMIELISLGVSVAMACKSCVHAHARAALEAGLKPDQLDEAVRIQAVLVGLTLVGDEGGP